MRSGVPISLILITVLLHLLRRAVPVVPSIRAAWTGYRDAAQDLADQGFSTFWHDEVVDVFGDRKLPSWSRKPGDLHFHNLLSA